VVVTRGGRAVARLIPVVAAPSHVERFGLLAAEIDDPGSWTDEDDEMADRFGLPAR